MFDPVVAAHFNNPASHVETLMHQIEVEKTYARFFEGRKDLTFLDIGANIGLVSLYAAPACSRIVAVEPAPETFRVLKAMTHTFPQIECVESALSKSDGKHVFFVNDLNSTASSTVNTYGIRTEVSSLTLAAILNIYQLENVDICKIDAEGEEGEALNFHQLINAKSIIRAFYIETHNCPFTAWEAKLGKLVEKLAHLGYHKMSISGMALIAEKP